MHYAESGARREVHLEGGFRTRRRYRRWRRTDEIRRRRRDQDRRRTIHEFHHEAPTQTDPLAAPWPERGTTDAERAEGPYPSSLVLVHPRARQRPGFLVRVSEGGKDHRFEPPSPDKRSSVR